MTSTLPRSVLAPPLPDTLWVFTVDGKRVAHEGFSGALAQCHTPMAGARRWTGHNHHALVDVWCEDCFGVDHCRRWVVDTLGRNRKRCGQPTGGAPECRWHHNQDVELDRQIGDAA